MAKLTPRRWHAKTHLPKLLHFKLIRWMPPNIRRVKQNMDGSANPQAGKASIGDGFRDPYGCWILIGYNQNVGDTTTLVAKLKAFVWVSKFLGIGAFMN